MPIHFLLRFEGMKEEEVDEVVLVGGTTRIPLIKQQLRYIFLNIIYYYYIFIIFTSYYFIVDIYIAIISNKK